MYVFSVHDDDDSALAFLALSHFFLVLLYFYSFFLAVDLFSSRRRLGCAKDTMERC